ncbi:facilitated trehalose transporter Tret1-2 homolog [Ctenocephalides felis]|uniref:facilitated trehalose transporter Tret1-2 homolog n=1 Tax=Ctenocephalides felis TaxID=7515 RepID=UPI000E6E4E2E|nr:facilitated trehalose transporter Tret1-2 homolog [Ctenocephalides felis]
MERIRRKERRRAIFKQLWLTLAVSMAFLGIGLVRGYSASALPSLRDLSPHLIPDNEALSWAGSVPPLGALIGSLLSAPLMQKLGLRRTLMISSPLWVGSWVLIALATAPWMLIVGRFLTGLMVGVVLPCAQIYVSECCSPDIRGILGSLPSLFMSGGILVSYILGTWLPWDKLAWSSAICVGLIILVVIPLPESPVWLAGHGKTEKAELSRQWLHLEEKKNDILMIETNGKNTNVEATPETKTEEINKDSNDENEKAFSWKTLTSRPVLCPLGIGLVVLALQQFSGIDSVVFYTVDIFRSSGSSLDGHIATILVGLVQLICNGLSLLLIDRAGRKPLLIGSGAVMSMAMASMGAAFYLHEQGNDSLGFLPLVSLVVFMIGFSFGYGCIPFLLIGELFPAKQRALLSSIAGSFNLAAMFLVIKTYHMLQDILTSAGTFWLYSILCASSILFVIFCVPETKGKSLEEIERRFQKKTPVPQNDSDSNHKVAEKNEKTKL